MKKKPNILFILTDDQGYWALNCAGNKDIKTPNLDMLAAEGMRFENFFCTSPVCSPARASIMTGMIPSRHGVHDWIKSGNLDKEVLKEKVNDPYYAHEKKAIPYLENCITYTDILAENGYHCALAGKWHLGDSIRPQHGFSDWFTIGRGGCSYYKADIVSEGNVRYEDRYVTDLIEEKAIEYIQKYIDMEEPFYLSVHFTAPHDPWGENEHPKEFIEMYRDCEFTATPDLPVHPNQIAAASSGTGEVRKSLLRGYYAAVSAMDAAVGRIIEELKRHDEYENTLIVFTADNGMNMGHHGIWGKGNGTFPLNLFDTSVKVPFIISHPARIPKGVVTDCMCSHYDIIQTLLDYLGIEKELPKYLPGKSFVPVLEGKEQEEHHIVIFDEYGPNRMIRNREWKYIHRYPYGPNELYHLTEDPDEDKNLIDIPEFQKIQEQLKKELMDWFYKYVDPALDAAHENVTGMGQLGLAGIYAQGKDQYGKIE